MSSKIKHRFDNGLFLSIYVPPTTSALSKPMPSSSFVLSDILRNKLGFKDLGDTRPVKTRNIISSDWYHAFPNIQDVQRPNIENCKGCLRCLLKSFDFSSCSGIVLTITGPGTYLNDEPMIRLQDGYLLPLTEILTALSDEQTNGLDSKPRIVVFEAYSNEHVDMGQEVTVNCKKETDSNAVQVEDEERRYVGDTLPEPVYGRTAILRSRRNASFYIPVDFFLILPTTTGQFSYYDLALGSWLHEAIASTINGHDFKQEPELDVLKLMTNVARLVSQRQSDEGNKNSVNITSTLRKTVVLTSK